MTEAVFRGLRASPGKTVGTIFTLATRMRVRERLGSADAEAAALRGAIERALNDLERLEADNIAEAAEIVAIQIALLQDPVLAEPAFSAIAAGAAADLAWQDTMDAEAQGYAASDDEYFKARASDILDLRDRVLAHLVGSGFQDDVPSGAIVAAVDLTPSRFLQIDWTGGGGLVLTSGSPTSHVAMLARARAIPALVGVAADLMQIRGPALLDADAGTLVLEPSSERLAGFEQARTSARMEQVAAAQALQRPGMTADGVAVSVLLNISHPSELERLSPDGCDGIGLVRTEFLFVEQRALPDEEEQYRAYRRIVEWAQGRPVTFRTLDAGGDKPVADFTDERETNPFLGMRGIRLSLRHPGVFRVQLRALARVAMIGTVKVMLPMVTHPSELEAARALLAEEVGRLYSEGVAAREPTLGIMVEVPAAALTAGRFDAAFYSIGSNDLAQYTAAVSRDHPDLMALADPVQPAMLRLIREVVEAATARGCGLTLCGDAAADPACVGPIIAAGVRALSVSPTQVGTIKLAISRTSSLPVEDRP